MTHKQKPGIIPRLYFFVENCKKPIDKCFQWQYNVITETTKERNTMTMIEKNLLKYIPKKLHQYVTVLCVMRRGVYALQLDIDGEKIPATVDGVANLRWAANYIYENREYNF